MRFKRNRNIMFRTQQGAALMLMLIIFVLGSLSFLVSSLSKSSISLSRESSTADALKEAKSGLLGYALNSTNRPGELPCPDTNNDGTAEALSGSNCSGGNIGRLPWKTLGLPKLQDTSGETLWYAVADAYHAGSSSVLNSNTNGTINITGTSNMSGLAAIVFAPGQVLPAANQNRSPANINNPAHFLESIITSPTNFNIASPNDIAGGAYSYNDRPIWITHDEIMAPVVKVILQRINDSALLRNYYDKWQAFPYAAPFSDSPGTSNYVGTNGMTYGLLPLAKQLGTAPPTPYWTANPSCTDQSGGGIGGTGTLRTSANSSCTAGLTTCVSARCTFSTPPAAGTIIKMTGTINNVGWALWRLYDPAIGAGSGSWASCTSTTLDICARLSSGSSYYPMIDKMNNTSISGNLNADGSATITLYGTVKSGSAINRIQFTTSGLPSYDLANLPSGANLNWLVNSNTMWHQTLYYAVSSGYAPGGNHTCSPTCLTVDGQAASAVAAATGWALQNQSAHPTSATLSDYLESSNAIPASGIYVNKTLDASFNDKVLSVIP